jgi:hypothetical protein
MYCGGSHLGFPISIKNIKFVEDLPMIIPGQFAFNCPSGTTRTIESKLPRNDHWKVLYKFYVFYTDRKSKMAATAIHRLTLDPMGKCSNAFFSDIFVVSEKKAFEHFPIGSNVNLCIAVAAILDFRSA